MPNWIAKSALWIVRRKHWLPKNRQNLMSTWNLRLDLMSPLLTFWRKENLQSSKQNTQRTTKIFTWRKLMPTSRPTRRSSNKLSSTKWIMCYSGMISLTSSKAMNSTSSYMTKWKSSGTGMMNNLHIRTKIERLSFPRSKRRFMKSKKGLPTTSTTLSKLASKFLTFAPRASSRTKS